MGYGGLYFFLYQTGIGSVGLLLCALCGWKFCCSLLAGCKTSQSKGEFLFFWWQTLFVVAHHVIHIARNLGIGHAHFYLLDESRFVTEKAHQQIIK